MKAGIRFLLSFIVAPLFLFLAGTVAVIAQPANDNCADAIEVSYGTTNFNTTNATTDGPDEPIGCDFNSYTHVENDIWYEFVAYSNCSHTFSLCGSGYDTKIAIYDASSGCPSSASVLICNDDFCSTQSEVTFNPATGKHYYIRIGGNSGATGTGTLTISAANCNPPTFNGCPTSVTLNNNNNQCTSVYNWTAPTANDNTGVASITGSHTPPVAFPVGTTTVTYVALDTEGNSSLCAFDVTVNDVQDPVLTGCPNNISQATDLDMCDAVVTWNPPTPSDNCPGVTMTSSHNPGDTFPLGTTTVTYTATDAVGNNVSCSFDITISDMQDPEITCPNDTTIGIDAGMCGAVFTYTAPIGTDNCAGASTSQTDATGLSSGSFFPLGSTTLEYTVDDAHGHSTTCSFTVTVVDDEDPVISCPSVTPVCSPDYVGAVMTWTAPVGTDNCPGAATVQSDNTGLTSGDVFPPGTTTIEYTVTDTAGNSASCSFDVVVYPKPLAEFSFSTACQGQPIYFTNETTVLTGNIVSYQWDMGDGGGIVTQVNPIHFYPSTGDYTVMLIVTTENGCMDTVSHVVTVTENPTAQFTTSPNVCLGGSVSFTNQSTVPVSYGGNLNYSWNFGDSNSSTDENPIHTYATSGTFTITLTVTTDDGCDDNYTSTVTIYPVPQANFTVTNPCLGEPTQFTNFSSVGSGTLSYEWDFGDSNTSTQQHPSHTYAADGVYTVVLISTSAQGCADTATNVVTLHPIPVAGFTTADVCEGTPADFNNTSSISSGTINFLWEFGDNSSSNSYNPTHSYLNDGTYTVFLVATSTFGCADTTNGSITIFPTPEFDLATDSVVCFGDTNGGIDVSVTVGSSPIIYQLDGGTGQASNQFPDLPAGTYNIQVTDDNGCFASDNVSVGQPSAPLSLNPVGQTGILCHGDLTGSIDVAGAGGTPSYQFSLNGGSFQSSGSFPDLSEGDYEVVLQDSRACVDTFQVSLTEPDTLIGAVDSVVDVDCFGGSDGQINVSAIGGIGPYSFSLDGISFNPVDSFPNLMAGDYVITIRDFNDCIDTVSASIDESSLLELSILDTHHVQCFGQNGGSISVVATGSTPAYEYSINGGTFQQDSNFYALPAGNYTIAVRDSNGCMESVTQTITEPGALSMSLSSQTVLCNGGNSGAIFITASGGTPNYQYSIDGGQNYFPNSTFNNLTAGNYVVSVRDTNGCTKSQGVVIQQPSAAVSVNISNLQHVLCRNDSTGAASFEVIGGTGSYTYSLDTGQTWQSSNEFSHLPAGTYNVLVSDVNGCTDDFQFNVSQPPVELGIDTILLQDLLCYDDNSGEIEITPEGGTPVYSFSINGGNTFQSQNVFSGLDAGTYDIVLEDYNGCTRTQTVQLTQPSQFILSLNSTVSPFCEGDTTGVINVFASGGAAPYEYTLNGGMPQGSGTYTSLMSGEYTAAVEDTNGCTVSIPVILEHENSLPIADFSYNTAGNSIAFDNNSQFNLENFWDFNDGTTSTEVNPIHTFNEPGMHWVTLIVSNVCGEDTISVQVNNSTSISEIDENELLNIYPNPNRGEFTLELTLDNMADNVELRVVDLNGKIQFSEAISVSSTSLLRNIDLQHLSNGLYLLEVQSGNIRAKKIIVVNK